MKFKVWDKIHGTQESAQEINADCDYEAAEKYADDDVDGGIDGLYNDGHEICVFDGTNVTTWSIIAEYSVSFHSSEVK